MTFDKRYFERQQWWFLILLNLPLAGQLLRRALWIDEPWLPVTKLTPTAVHFWRLRPRKFRIVAYSNAQYAEALHRSFTWLWSLVHAWDMRIANRWIPALNFGLDTFSVQPDGTAGVDNFMRSTEATTANGSSDNFMVGESNASVNQVNRGLIKFDLSSITSGYTADDATFSLWSAGDFSDNARTFRVYRMIQPWNETQSTWNIHSTGNNWTTAGAFAAADCEQTEIGSRAMTATEANGEKQWTTWDLVGLQQQFGATPTFTNNGWLVKADTETNDAYLFRSSDFATAGDRPKLVINYTAFISFGQRSSLFPLRNRRALGPIDSDAGSAA